MCWFFYCAKSCRYIFNIHVAAGGFPSYTISLSPLGFFFFFFHLPQNDQLAVFYRVFNGHIIISVFFRWIHQTGLLQEEKNKTKQKNASNGQ